MVSTAYGNIDKTNTFDWNVASINLVDRGRKVLFYARFRLKKRPIKLFEYFYNHFIIFVRPLGYCILIFMLAFSSLVFIFNFFSS